MTKIVMVFLGLMVEKLTKEVVAVKNNIVLQKEVDTVVIPMIISLNVPKTQKNYYKARNV